MPVGEWRYNQEEHRWELGEYLDDTQEWRAYGYVTDDFITHAQDARTHVLRRFGSVPLPLQGPDTGYPVRQASAHGKPKPRTSIERRCKTCGASFIKLAPGITGLTGLWDHGSNWYCSTECAPQAVRALLAPPMTE